MIPAYVYPVKDRHGKTRYRFRKAQLPSRYLPIPGSEGFDEEYRACFDPASHKPRRAVKRKPPPKVSYRHLKGRQLVYFISMAGGVVKIGTTTNLTARIKKLQTGNPAHLRVLAVIDGGADVEAAYHHQFADARLKGEWFKRTDAVKQEIERLFALGVVHPPVVQPEIPSNKRVKSHG